MGEFSVITKTDIERDVQGKGDFVQIDHLTRFLKQNLASDVRRFVYQKLAEIYERRAMYNEAAKTCHGISEFSVTYKDKIAAHLKEAELYIKAGYFERSDEALRKALSEATSPQKKEVLNAIKDFYKRQAEVYVKEKRRANAVKLYEKILTINITPEERDEVKKKLLELYEQLGKVREFYTLKKKFDNLPSEPEKPAKKPFNIDDLYG